MTRKTLVPSATADVVAASQQKYAAYGTGWLPDFPEADNFLAPFVGEGNFLNSPYRNAEITGELIPRTRASGERTAAEREFVRAQKVIADEVPSLPLWQSKGYIAARDGITWIERSPELLLGTAPLGTGTWSTGPSDHTAGAQR